MIKPQVKNIKIKSALNSDIDITVRKDINSNEYLQVGNYWIRNFASDTLNPLDINVLHKEEEIKLVVENEINNTKILIPEIDAETIRCRDMLIVSDGYGFNSHKLFDSVRDDVCIVCVNHAARFWQSSRFPNFMLVNNPSNDCMSFLPVNNYPRLIASRRTNNNFIKNYKNIIYFYDPVPCAEYQSPLMKNNQILIDDYRNPICAAISLAKKYDVQNIFLAFCSSAYSEKRAGTEEVQDGIYQYPQQKLADNLIDGLLFWYKFSNNFAKIFHTGYENKMNFSTYLQTDDFVKAIS